MNIYYDEHGTILEVTGVDVERADEHISVPDAKLPEDLLATFALGKYRVRNGKLSPNRSFAEPDDRLIASILPEGLLQTAAPGSADQPPAPERVRRSNRRDRASGKPPKA